MNKTALFLSSILLVTSGCNTPQMIKDAPINIQDIVKIPKTWPTWPGSGNTEKRPLPSGEDIEDAACAKITYKKRTTCRIQVHLNDLGYGVGVEDGIAGKNTNTERGIRKFQSKQNVKPIDGKPSFKLLTALRKENVSGTNPLITAALSAAACGSVAAFLNKDSAMWFMICGTGGAILQDLSNKGKEEYAMRYYEIKDENDRTENEINQIASQIQENRNKTKSYQSEIKTLIANEKDDKIFLSKAGKLRDLLDEQARNNKRERNKAKAKMVILDDQIKDVNEILAEKPSEEEFIKTLAALKAKKASLIDAVDQSNGLEQKLVAQKSTLDNAIIERS